MDDVFAIETKRLILRPLKPDHAEGLHSVYADPRAMRFWAEAPHRSLDETRAMIAGMLAGPGRAWAIFPRGGPAAIGLVYYLGNPGPPGMGYILHPDHWGNGLMPEAVREVLEFGFLHMGLDRVELWIDARNLASQKVADRAGFKRRGAFRQKYGHDAASHEKLVYGLSLVEWRPGDTPPLTRPFEAYSLQPVLAVPDVAATAAYYRDMLGFEIAFLLGEPARYGIVRLGMWTATGVKIRFALSDQPPTTTGLSLYLNVGPDIEALYEAYRSRGVVIVGELATTPWGQREFTIRDSNGYVLEFGTPG